MTYANVMATVAVFVALGGTSYAALSLPANSVGTRQIKRNAVTLGKIAPDSRRALRGEVGPRGSQGTQGPAGPQGAQGAQGVSGLQGSQGDPGVAGRLGPTFGTTATASLGFFSACTSVTMVSKTFSLAQAGMVYLEPAGDGVYANGNSNGTVQYTLLLDDATGSTNLAQVSNQSYMNWSDDLPEAPLPSGAIMPQSDGSPYIAAPGTYVAELTADVSGACSSSSLTTLGPTQLSVIEIGSGG